MSSIKKETLNYITQIYQSEDFIVNPTAYFYDMSIVGKNIEELEKNMPSQVRLYYAMKANPNEEIMQEMHEHNYVKGIEIASAGELERALQYYSGKDIIFTGPGKTDFELEQAIVNSIRLINVESMTEAVRINNIIKRLDREPIDVLLRINLNYSVIDGVENMSGYSTKMGIDEEVYIENYKAINRMEGINVRGIHAFAASGVLDYQTLLDVDRYIFDFVDRLQQEVGNIDIIDLGGGLGIDYTDQNRELNVIQYGKHLSKLIEQYNLVGKEIIMELGTYIVGNAGYYTAKIIDIKKVKGKKHIIIAGGVNHMGLPLEMRRKHPVRIIQMHASKLYPEQMGVYKETVDISGPLCIVSDKLSWDEYIECAEIGDIVVYLQAGAYCFGEGMHEFLMHMRPAEVTLLSAPSPYLSSL